MAGAPPFPPYFAAVSPYMGAPPQPFVASSVPPCPYGIPPQAAAIPLLLPPVTAHATVTTAGECLLNEAHILI